MKTVVHKSRVRYIGDRTVTGTLCNRFRVGNDGMNLSDQWSEVTCKFCVKRREAERKMIRRDDERRGALSLS